MYHSDSVRLTAFTRGEMSSTVQVALIAVFTALTTVATVVISVPFPTSTGYLNFGDALVMISGFLLGPTGGFIAGGFGSAMGDVALGYTQFAPITFLVKGCEGAVVGMFSRRAIMMRGTTDRPVRGLPPSDGLKAMDVLGLVLAAMTMLVGYFLFEIPLVGLGAAVAEMTTVNWVQVTAAAVVTLIIGPGLRSYLITQIPTEIAEDALASQPASETTDQ